MSHPSYLNLPYYFQAPPTDILVRPLEIITPRQLDRFHSLFPMRKQSRMSKSSNIFYGIPPSTKQNKWYILFSDELNAVCMTVHGKIEATSLSPANESAPHWRTTTEGRNTSKIFAMIWTEKLTHGIRKRRNVLQTGSKTLLNARL